MKESGMKTNSGFARKLRVKLGAGEQHVHDIKKRVTVSTLVYMYTESYVMD